jgi:hypothetical protein
MADARPAFERQIALDRIGPGVAVERIDWRTWQPFDCTSGDQPGIGTMTSFDFFFGVTAGRISLSEAARRVPRRA